jgi:hypothetical protein
LTFCETAFAPFFKSSKIWFEVDPLGASFGGGLGALLPFYHGLE